MLYILYNSIHLFKSPHLADYLCDLCNCSILGNNLKQSSNLFITACRFFSALLFQIAIIIVFNNKVKWALFLVNVEIIVFQFFLPVKLTYVIYIHIFVITFYLNQKLNAKPWRCLLVIHIERLKNLQLAPLLFLFPLYSLLSWNISNVRKHHCHRCKRTQENKGKRTQKYSRNAETTTEIQSHPQSLYTFLFRAEEETVY